MYDFHILSPANTVYVCSMFSNQNDYLKYPEPRAGVVIYTPHKSYEFSHLHLQINKKSNPEALLFKPGVQFLLTDSEEIFFATCTFTINCRMRTSNPGHGLNCIRCYHQSLSVGNMSSKLTRDQAAVVGCIVLYLSRTGLFRKLCIWP